MLTFSPSYHFSRKQYLRLFVSTLCRNGDGGKLSLFPFTGLIDEVERMLLLKAESQHVLSKPDPYKTLYAFYCYRGDYRNGKRTRTGAVIGNELDPTVFARLCLEI